MKCAICGERIEKSQAMHCSICGTTVCQRCAKLGSFCSHDQGEFLFYN